MSKRSKRERQKANKANKARGARPLRMEDPVGPVTYANLNTCCMEMELARKVWILVATDEVDGVTAYYSRIASAAIACIGLATFYGSEKGADRARVQFGGGFIAVNLLNHLEDAMGHRGRDDDSGGDEDPETPQGEPGGSHVVNKDAFAGLGGSDKSL